MASIDINKTIDEIVTKAREEYDRFVFETIAPYCETVSKMEITKADLEEALTVWKSYKEGAFERKTEWIPVTERLPEEDGDYLVTTLSLYGTTKFVTTRDFSEGRWTYDSAVTAWMPLPKPYEEGAEE